MSNFLIDFSKRHAKTFLTFLVQPLVRIGIHPIVLTLLALVCGLVALYFFSNKALFIFFGGIHLLFDMLDGSLARALHKTSPLGTFLDSLSDRLIEGLLLILAPVTTALTFFAFGLFFIQLILFFFTKTMFYARTLLFLFFVFGLFTPGVVVALLFYSVGIIFQLFYLVRRRNI